ncbi:DUF3284 domain-containing protein [Clostridium sp. HCS.1]|uniref:DUF3284 domain-containing protein n=1 Tax=Clostridium sp. HCS.1 TaxID=3238594 RepID=UPI003A0FE719
MSNYKIKTTVNYPIERVFKVFIDLNKREIPKFNDKNPVGCSNKRTIKYVAKQKIEMLTTVTGYEKNKLYEVTNSIDKDKYISKYTFSEIDSNSTEISLSEAQDIKSFSSKLTVLIQKIGAKKKMKEKINNLKEILEKELERRDKGTVNKEN